MRQLCPYCAKLVDLPDAAAGTEAPCPECGKSFAVPKAFVPSVGDKPATISTAPTVDAPLPPVPSGELREHGFTLSIGPAGWVPVLSLTVALIASLFFSWVGSFPGGVRAFAQSPVQALFATYSGNTIPSLQDADKGIETNIRSNWLMLPYFLALLIVTVLAWLERLFPNPTLSTLPAPLGWFVTYWPRRFLVMTALTTAALVLMLQQSWRGFGLESAIRDMTVQQFAKQTESADTPHLKQEVKIRIGQEQGKFCLDDTNANVIGWCALCLALESLLVYWWLARRGDKPAPRIILRS